MTDERLTINNGETYRIPKNQNEQWSGATIDGQLDLNGTVEFIDNPTTPGEEPFSLEDDGFSLPLKIESLRMVTTGFGFFLVGTLAVLGGLSAVLRNYAAGIVLMLAVLALVMAGTVGLSLTYYYALIVGTVLVLAVGMVLRWMNS